MINDYKSAYEFFYGQKNHYIDMGTKNLENFLKGFDSPQDKLKVIQVAGTNAKGSVSSFLAYILIEQGYKVGRYNSPVVFEERENITVNNVPMSSDEFTEIIKYMENNINDAQKKGILPTVFELETAMAYIWFEKNKCDFVIMECGLGGRDDATNVVKENELAIITSVSMDHMQYLGDTKEKIADIKAKIMKKDSCAVCGVNDEAVKEVIKKNALKYNNEIRFVEKCNIEEKNISLDGQRFSYKTEDKIYDDIWICMLGTNQAENAALAIEAVRMLKKRGYDISDESIRKGLGKMKIRGRFDVVCKEPLFITDGAHNEDAALRLSENIKKYLSGYDIILIMGVFADKEYEKIIENMKEHIKDIIVTNARGDRALNLGILKNEILKKAESANVYEMQEYKDVCNYAKSLVKNEKTAIIAFGSLSYLKYLM